MREPSYAEHVWEETLYQQRIVVFDLLQEDIEIRLKNEGKPAYPEQSAEIDDWKLAREAEQNDWRGQLAVSYSCSTSCPL
jgi:hypothetical protein